MVTDEQAFYRVERSGGPIIAAASAALLYGMQHLEAEQEKDLTRMIVSQACQRQDLRFRASGVQAASAFPAGAEARYTWHLQLGTCCSNPKSSFVNLSTLGFSSPVVSCACALWFGPHRHTLASCLRSHTGLTAWLGKQAQDMPTARTALHAYQADAPHRPPTRLTQMSMNAQPWSRQLAADWTNVSAARPKTRSPQQPRLHA